MSYRPYTKILSAGVAFIYTNNTGFTIVKGTPVRKNSSGTLDFIDPSIEANVQGFIGVAAESIANSTSGSVALMGRIEDVTSLIGNFGDPVYLNTDGGLTGDLPSIGVGAFVAGDTVARIGVIAKNESNPLVKDLVLEFQIIGVL